MSKSTRAAAADASAELDARVLRPERPQLAEALACVLAMEPEVARELAATDARWDEAHWTLEWTRGGETRRWRTERDLAGPADAWETLAARGLIPMAWPGDERRRFVSYELWRAPCGPNFDPIEAPHPVTLRSCVTLASDPDGVATAEALAREVCARLRPWGLPATERVLWRTDERPTDNRGMVGDGFSARIAAALGASATEASLSRDGWRGDPGGPANAWRASWRARARALVRAAAAWKRAAAQRRAVPADVLGDARTFAELPDPYPPLLDLWRRGYALDEVRESVVVLLAREV